MLILVKGVAKSEKYAESTFQQSWKEEFKSRRMEYIKTPSPFAKI
jgi:hypothetical protein